MTVKPHQTRELSSLPAGKLREEQKQEEKKKQPLARCCKYGDIHETSSPLLSTIHLPLLHHRSPLPIDSLTETAVKVLANAFTVHSSTQEFQSWHTNQSGS